VSTVSSSVENSLATVRLGRVHGNAINLELLRDLEAELETAKQRKDIRGVLLAASGKLFCPGLDLRDLLDYDRPAMAELMTRFRRCLLALFTLPKPVVVAIHAHALAGGFVLALTADWRVMARAARIGLNEVRVGVPLPYGVTQILRDVVRGGKLETVALLGSNYTGAEALQAGLVDELHPAPEVAAAALERLGLFADKDPASFAVTKAHLRRDTAERIATRDAHYLDEFLDCWFQSETRSRIEQIAQELEART